MKKKINNNCRLAHRFRGFLPIVVDVETGGFNPKTDALIEISLIVINMCSNGILKLGNSSSFHLIPFKGANIEKSALDFIKVDPFNPLRIASEEQVVLNNISNFVQSELVQHSCSKAILVGHNASFDLAFLLAALERNNIKNTFFHSFSCFDTVTLSGLAYGQTVLAKACKVSKIDFDAKKAHSAKYDAEKTAQLFCNIVNQWFELGGWPLQG